MLGKIGILGGMGWPSTAHYYRCICLGSQRHFAGQGLREPLPVPEISIESVNIHEVRALRPGAGTETTWDAYEAHLRAGLRRLADAGCDFALMATNTPHQRLDGIRAGLSLPLLSILDTTADAVAGLGATKAVLLGTSKTMAGPAYPRVLEARGIECIRSADEGFHAEMDRLIDHGLIAGSGEEASLRLLELARGLGGAQPGAVVLLACTELPLAFPDHLFDEHFELDGMTLVNTTTVHAMAALRRALA